MGKAPSRDRSLSLSWSDDGASSETTLTEISRATVEIRRQNDAAGPKCDGIPENYERSTALGDDRRSELREQFWKTKELVVGGDSEL